MSSGLKVLVGILGGAVLVLMLLVVFAGSGPFSLGPMMGSGGMMGQGDTMGGGWGVFGIVWMLVPLWLLGGLIVIIVWAVTHIHEQSAEEILGQLFARAEIDAEEYEERRRILNEQHRREVPK